MSRRRRPRACILLSLRTHDPIDVRGLSRREGVEWDQGDHGTMKPNVTWLKANGTAMVSTMPDESASADAVLGRMHLRYDCSR
jgi:hypothetical protein